MRSIRSLVLVLSLLTFQIPFNAHAYDFYEDETGYYEEYADSGDIYEEYYPQREMYVQNSRNEGHERSHKKSRDTHSKSSSRLPDKISAHGERVLVINPRVHAWGAYDASGNLIRSGVATSGANYCTDVKRACRTSVGTFRIYSLGSSKCKSSKYPLPKGGAPMPYCMFFNKNQAIHGSNQVRHANLSHGCVRVHVSDAEWIRFEFARVGTKVIVKPY